MPNRRLLISPIVWCLLALCGSVPAFAAGPRVAVCNIYDRAGLVSGQELAEFLTAVLTDLIAKSGRCQVIPQTDLESCLIREFDGATYLDMGTPNALSVGNALKADAVIFGNLEGSEGFRITLQLLSIPRAKAKRIESERYPIPQLLNAVLELYPKSMKNLIDDFTPAGLLSGYDQLVKSYASAYDFFILGVDSALVGNYGATAGLLGKVNELVPQYRTGRVSAGCYHLLAHQDDAAITAFVSACSLGVSQPGLPIALACAYYKTGQYDSAVRVLERVPDRPPAPYAWGLLGSIYYFARNDSSRALRLFERASASNSQMVPVLCNRAFHAMSGGDDNTAIELFRRAIAADSSCYQAHFFLMNLYLKKQDKLNAFVEAENCYQYSPEPDLDAALEQIVGPLGYHFSENASSNDRRAKGRRAFNPLLSAEDRTKSFFGRAKQEEWILDMYIRAAIPEYVSR